MNDRLQYIPDVHDSFVNVWNGSFFVVQWLLILAVTKRQFSAGNLPFAASGNPAPGVIGYGQVRPTVAVPRTQ